MCARCRFLCVGMSVFSAVLLCKSTNRIYVNPRIEASLLPTSFQAISQLMLTEMCGRNWGYVRSLSLMFFGIGGTSRGGVLNTESLANDCGISVDTAKSWLSILGSSFIAFRLRPYFKNYGKRITKASKLYFYDTGLAAHLLGIESTEQLILSNHRGNLFENLVVTEIIKRYEALEKRPRLYHWRDSNRKEIDLIIEKGGKPYYLIEIKSSATFRPEAFSTIDSIAPEMGVPCERRFVVYGGSDSFGNRHGRVIGFRNLGELVE